MVDQAMRHASDPHSAGRLVCALGLALSTPAVVGQTLAIQSISVCSPTGSGGAGSCPAGTFDTHQIVLAPDGSGNSINKYGGLGGISDEHQSVFAPGTLQNNTGYLFFVATRTTLNADTGVVVLSGSGPNPSTGQIGTSGRSDGSDESVRVAGPGNRSTR